MVVELFKPPAFGEEVTEESSQATKLVPENLDDRVSSNEPVSTQAEKYDFTNLEEAQIKHEKIDYSDFDSTKFNKVGTLLTNVEDYSKKIREDVENYDRHIRDDVDLLKSEVELELAQALIEKKDAEEKAANIVKEAKESRDKIVEDAKKEGFEEIAENFTLTANQEAEHAKWLMRMINELKGDMTEYDEITIETGAPTILKDTKENLKAAIGGENFEYTSMYPEFAKAARKEGFIDEVFPKSKFGYYRDINNVQKELELIIEKLDGKFPRVKDIKEISTGLLTGIYDYHGSLTQVKIQLGYADKEMAVLKEILEELGES